MSRFIPSSVLLNSPRRRFGPRTSPPPPAGAQPATSVDVAIVGGGPAAIALAVSLWHAGVRDTMILERSGILGGQFLRRVDHLRQAVLRSPYEHHPGAEGYADCEMIDFARLRWEQLTHTERHEVRMSQAGHRSVVPIDVFEAFLDHISVSHELAERTIPANVKRIEDPHSERPVLVTDLGTVSARFVVLACGERRREMPESWARGLGEDTCGTAHYWDEQSSLVPGKPYCVIGSGLSAAHLVMNALTAGSPVTWAFRRSEVKYQCADVNAAYFRAEGRAAFEGDRSQRLRMLRDQRIPSVMFEFRELFEAAAQGSQLRLAPAFSVQGVAATDNGFIITSEDGRSVRARSIGMALGTVPEIGASLLSEEIIGSADGWPSLNPSDLSYKNAKNIFAVGAAACLAVGPAARNIDGHRVCAQRVSRRICRELA